MKRTLIALGALTLAAAASAQLNAAGSLSYVQNGGQYTYDVTLRNTGTTTIGTLWYAWIPGEDYLPVAPTSTSSPAGWSLKVIDSTATGFGYSLQWKAQAGSLLAAGSSLGGFTFTTSATPAQLAGAAPFGANPPTGTSFVYQAAPFADPGLKIVLNPVPEPTPFLAVGVGLAAIRRRRKAR